MGARSRSSKTTLAGEEIDPIGILRETSKDSWLVQLAAML
jgi:hypothetical protein